jgi:hypothetical protein
MKLNGKLNESISEYKKALELKSKLCSKHDRALSNIHFLIAIAYIYRAAEKSNIDPLQDKREALEHYQLSKEVRAVFLSSISIILPTFHRSFVRNLKLMVIQFQPRAKKKLKSLSTNYLKMSML